jgi:hypothetical protein
MPNKPTDKPLVCFESRHLPGHLYKAHDVMLAYTNGGIRPFYAAVKPTFANMLNCTANTATACINELCKLGWLIQRGGGRHPQTGRQLPYEYEVLTHDEFVKRHPGSCPPLKYAVTDDQPEDSITLAEMDANPLLRNRIFQTPLGQAIDEWEKQLTDEQRDAVRANWKTLQPSRPQPTEDAAAVLGTPNRTQSTEHGNRPRQTESAVLGGLNEPSSADRISRPQPAEEYLVSIPLGASSSSSAAAKQLLTTMKRTYAEKYGDILVNADRYFPKLVELVAEFGSARVEEVWHAFLKAERWKASWREHMKLFVDDFVGHAVLANRKPETGGTPEDVLNASREAAASQIAATWTRLEVEPEVVIEDDEIPF